MRYAVSVALALWLGLGLPALTAAQDGVEAEQPAEDLEGFDDLQGFEDLDDFDEGPVVSDPLEPVNRGVFWFNDRMYVYVLKPVARAYRVVPEPTRVSVANFFSNLGAPIRFVNALAQAKINKAGIIMSRFFINTTAGIGGLFDPARKYADLREQDEDFGQTLGAYGVGSGFYVVLPFIGPSTLRDAAGRLVDGQLDVVAIAADDTGEYVAVKAVDTVNSLSLDKDTYDQIRRDALDPYLFVRDAYIQLRQGKIER